MPSNHRSQKTTTITLKAANRRVNQPPTPDLSGDEGYSALEDFESDDDDDDDNVFAAEEEHLITDVTTERSIRSPRPLFYDSSAEQDGDGDDEDEGLEEEDDLTYQHGDDEEGGEADGKSWNGISDETDNEGDLNELDAPFGAIHTERHVRFANVPDTDSDSTDTDDDHADFFPDIFVDQATLDPSLRREIDRDPEESSSSGSFWDFQSRLDGYSSGESEADLFLPTTAVPTAVPTAPASDEEPTPTATPVAPSVGGLESGVSSPTRALDLPVDLGGYETDGDTTEEDVPEPLVRRRSRRSEAGDDSDAEYTPVKSDRGKPRVGRFNLDKSDRKPIAVLNPITRKMMIFTPHKHRQLDLSPEQFDFAFFSSVETSSPVANPSNYMLDSMFSSNTFGDFMNHQDFGDLGDLGDLGDMGDVDALLQSALMSESNAFDDSVDSEIGADEAEKNLDINDFITFGGGAVSESESEAEASVNDTPGGPSGSDAEMLSHLTSATVGAFRQNQITQQLIFSNKATQDSLAFSGPFNDTAIRGLKSDRLATAGTPLTPVRRRRKSSVHQEPASPLEQMAQKRKASGEHEGHKRQRSISDMAMLRV